MAHPTSAQANDAIARVNPAQRRHPPARRYPSHTLQLHKPVPLAPALACTRHRGGIPATAFAAPCTLTSQRPTMPLLAGRPSRLSVSLRLQLRTLLQSSGGQLRQHYVRNFCGRMARRPPHCCAPRHALPRWVLQRRLASCLSTTRPDRSKRRRQCHCWAHCTSWSRSMHSALSLLLCALACGSCSPPGWQP